MNTSRQFLRVGLLLITLLTLAGMSSGQSDDAPLAPLISRSTDFGTQGAYAVIVDLHTPTYQPERMLRTPAAVQSQRAAIRSAQDDLLRALAVDGIAPGSVKRFETVSGVAMIVDEAGLAALRRDSRVNAVYEDRIMHAHTEFGNDLIDAPEAWAQLPGYDGVGYAVAVMDTGIDNEHPAVNGEKLVAEGCFNTISEMFGSVSSCPNDLETQSGAGAGDPDDGTRYGPCDGCYHGTFVAGIAAGFVEDFGNDPNFDFYGVARGADLIAVNVFSLFTSPSFCAAVSRSAPCTASYTSDQIRGLEYVLELQQTDPNVDVAAVNLSLGGGRYFDTAQCVADEFAGYLEAVANLTDAGVAVVASSGNSGWADSISQPACYPNVISVGSVGAGRDGTTPDAISSFSNSAPFMDLLAPGERIYSTQPVESGLFTTRSGTSFAAPFVAGHFAILRQLLPDASVTELLDHIKATGDLLIDPRNNLPKPRIDVYSSLFPATPQIISPTGPILTSLPTLTWQPSLAADDYSVIVRDAVAVVDSASGLTDCAQTCTYTVSAPLDPGSYTFEISAANGVGNSPLAVGAFYVTSAAPNGAVVSTTPAFTFVDLGAPYSWYQIVVTDNGGVETFSQWYEASEVCADDICMVRPSTAVLPFMLGDANLNWTLNAYNANSGAVEGGDTLALVVRAPVLAGPTEITERDGAFTFNILELSAGGVTADYYRVYFADVNDGFTTLSDQWISADICADGVCVVYPEQPLGMDANGDYRVWLQAYSDDVGYSNWSDAFDITADVPPPPIGPDDETPFEVNIGWLIARNVNTTPVAVVGGCPFGPQENDPRTCPTPDVWLTLFVDAFNVVKGVEFDVYRVSDNQPILEGVYPIEAMPADTICQDFGNALACFVPLYGLDEGEYVWRMRSVGVGGPSAEWIEPGSEFDTDNVTTFAITHEETPAIPLAVVGEETDDLPADGTQGEIHFQFTDRDAVWYRLMVRNVATGAMIYDGWLQTGAGVTCGLTVAETPACEAFPGFLDLPNGNYRFNVDYWSGGLTGATGNVINGAASDAFTFTQAQPAPVLPSPEAMTAQRSIATGETLTGQAQVKFNWPRIDGVTFYNLQVAAPDGVGSINGVDVWLRDRDVCTAATCTHTVVSDLSTLPAGQYNWSLAAYGPGGYTVTDDPANPRVTATFTVENTTPGTPLLVEPDDNATVEVPAPDFVFEPTENTTWYNLQIRTEDAPDYLVDAWLPADELICDEATCTFSDESGLTYTLPQGDLQWRVRAYGPADVVVASDFADFTVDVPLSTAPTLSAPADQIAVSGAEDAQFIWFAGENAQWYNLVFLNTNNAEVYSEWLTSGAAGCAIGCRYTVPAGTLAPGTYTWSVRSWGQGNSIDPLQAPASETRTITILAQ